MLWVHKMYFYVNLSCDEANLNKFSFVKWRVSSFLAFFNWGFDFFQKFCWPFLAIFYWRFGLFWKNKSDNPGWTFALHCQYAATYRRDEVGLRTIVSKLSSLRLYQNKYSSLLCCTYATANWATHKLRLGCGLDEADEDLCFWLTCVVLACAFSKKASVVWC